MTEPIPRFRTLTLEEQHSYEARHIRPSLIKCDDGNLVAYSDYAALAADKEAETKAVFDAIRLITQLRDENERLKALVESNLNAAKKVLGQSYALRIERDALAAENERLRKAGDALAEDLHYFPTDNTVASVQAWLAAKEGSDAN